MAPAKLDTWVWVLVYGGLLTLALGLSLAREEAALGWSLVAGGGAAAALGVLLIYLRSRMKG